MAKIPISIHAPRMGSDLGVESRAYVTPYFNPRPPYGERRSTAAFTQIMVPISIHAPRMGSDIDKRMGLV